MRRRAFIALLGAGAAWPLAARAQQATSPVIGFIGVTSHEEWRDYVAAFHRGLNDTGYVEGRNVTIEYRWAEGRYDRLPAMASDLVGRKADVIVAIARRPRWRPRLPLELFRSSSSRPSLSSPNSLPGRMNELCIAAWP
jgi:ABC-type uncharacterized transport system substrate-binding protein